MTRRARSSSEFLSIAAMLARCSLMTAAAWSSLSFACLISSCSSLFWVSLSANRLLIDTSWTEQSTNVDPQNKYVHWTILDTELVLEGHWTRIGTAVQTCAHTNRGKRGDMDLWYDTYFSLIECEGRTGGYRLGVLAVRTEPLWRGPHKTEGRYSPNTVLGKLGQ